MKKGLSVLLLSILMTTSVFAGVGGDKSLLENYYDNAVVYSTQAMIDKEDTSTLMDLIVVLSTKIWFKSDSTNTQTDEGKVIAKDIDNAYNVIILELVNEILTNKKDVKLIEDAKNSLVKHNKVFTEPR